MTSIVYKKSYSAPPINKREALRYAGVRGESAEAEAMLDECITEAADPICPAEQTLLARLPFPMATP